MEIRKFIIELHPDGKVTWCEYEEPRSELFAFSAGARRAADVIISAIDKRRKSHRNLQLAGEDVECIELIKEMFPR